MSEAESIDSSSDDSSVPDAADVSEEADSQLHHWRIEDEDSRGVCLLCSFCEEVEAPLFLMGDNSPQCLPCAWKIILPRNMPDASRADWLIFFVSHSFL